LYLSTLSNSYQILVLLYLFLYYNLMNQSTVVFGVFKKFYRNISNSASPGPKPPTGALICGSTLFEIITIVP